MSTTIHARPSRKPLMEHLENRLLMAAVSGSGYAAFELRPVNGSVSATTRAYALNNTGLAVGESSNYGAAAWRVDAAGVTPLALPEIHAAGYSAAYDVNDLGQVVGMSATPDFVVDNWRVHHAVLWQSMPAGGFTITDLGTLPGHDQSAAFDINDAGQVLGTATTGQYAPSDSGGGTYFLWDSVSGMRSIASLLPADSGWTVRSATDINNSGRIVGQGVLNGVLRGYQFDLSSSSIVPLPGLADDNSYPTALNGEGTVVGAAYVRTDIDPYYGPMDVSHAAVWSSGGVTNLGTLGDRGSLALGVNNGGTAVGWSNSKKKGKIIDLFGINTATIWSNGTMKDINSLKSAKTPWQMTRAFDVNDAGTIVTEAYGVSRINNYTRGLLMQPKVQATMSSATITSSSTTTDAPTRGGRAFAAGNLLGGGTIITDDVDSVGDESADEINA